jgi:hypothetical protein
MNRSGAAAPYCGRRGPPDLVERVPEVVPGYPDRIVPVSPTAAAILKKRTLTNLYNERPAWLDNAHRDLDAAVAAAYGWPADLREEEVLTQLLALNLERALPANEAIATGIRGKIALDARAIRLDRFRPAAANRQHR